MNRQTNRAATIVLALVSLFAGPFLAERAPAAENFPRLPAGIVLEEKCADPSLDKIVLIAGSTYFKPGQHEYLGGCAVLMNLLRQSPGVFPVLAVDWPRKSETLSGAKTVVFFFDGGDKHAWLDASRRMEVKQLADAGVGLVCFHQCIDVPTELGPQVRAWMGAVFEKGFSQRAHWVAQFEKFPEHPVCRGVTPFQIDDGWLYKLRYVDGMQGVSPLLRTVSPRAKLAPEPDDSIVSWVYQRPGGGRSFTFTGCHLHSSLAEAGYRKFLTNGILWAAGRDVPTTGAPIEFDPATLDSYLSPPPTTESK
jgi:type 1 glutamine amidotransferase